MSGLNRNRSHSYGYTTETVTDGFRTQANGPQTESCGTVTVSAETEGGDTGGDNGGDTGGDAGGDTGGDNGGDTGGGGGTNGDDTGGSEDPGDSNGGGTVPESIPYLGGRKYTDPQVLAAGAGGGFLLYTLASDDN